MTIHRGVGSNESLRGDELPAGNGERVRPPFHRGAHRAPLSVANRRMIIAGAALLALLLLAVAIVAYYMVSTGHAIPSTPQPHSLATGLVAASSSFTGQVMMS